MIVDGNMETAPPAKSRRRDTNYKLCIICQSGIDKDLIVAPSSHKKVLDVIRERARYGDGNFPEISRRLANVTHEELKLKSATWHRKCYQDTVHAGMCRRAKERYEKKLLDMNTPESSSWTQSPSGSSFTRSQSVPYNKDLCFFCECSGSVQNPLHKVSTTSAGKALNHAIQKSGNEKLYVKLWSPMKKQKLQTWKVTGKRVKVSAGDEIVEFKEDRKLFTRMLLLSKSRSNIDLEEAVGSHELSVVPRSMFAADGTMLHCSSKSSLMSVLEKLTKKGDSVPDTNEEIHDSVREEQEGTPQEVKVAILDDTAQVQSLDKPDYITYCIQLANHFTSRILARYGDADEIHLVFDQYDVPTSLKTATRDRRQGSQPSVVYYITDSTNVSKVPMKKLLAHVTTKCNLTSYLAEKMLEKAAEEKKQMVIAWGAQCQATHRNVSHLHSQQEEADTKLLLHATDATSCGASVINIHSPDTDVFVLGLRRYLQLCKKTNFVTGTGTNRRFILLGPIYNALGPEKSAALPGLQAISGADNTGSFAGTGKLSFWKAFKEASDDEVSALGKLGTTPKPSDILLAGIEKFICKYIPARHQNYHSSEAEMVFVHKEADAV